MEFKGKKYNYIDSVYVRDESIWWDEVYVEKKQFAMTKKYKEYLENKRMEKEKIEIAAMKAKLDYQMKMYGKVDEIDFQEYMLKIKNYI